MTPAQSTYSALQRLPGWPERLSGHVQRHLRQPFAWGVNDCVLFAAGAVQCVTGASLLPLQAWAGRRAALLALRQAGGLRAAVQGVLPALPSPGAAWRGDVVLVQGAGRQWLAVVVDGGRWVSPGRNGLHMGPISQVVQAWGVAHG